MVPVSLRKDVLTALHKAHQGSTNMSLRASESVWWPGLAQDIATAREMCNRCVRNAPTQPAMPPTEPRIPDYPFQLVAADYFAYAGHSYIVIVDRYSGWPCVSRCCDESADELVRLLRTYFCSYGVPEEIASDGASVFMSATTKRFLGVWGVSQRISSAYFPHSNLRAETGVKSVKRLIADNTGTGGSLETDSFAAALLQYRNTPDRDTGLSPAQVLYARQLRDAVPTVPSKLELRKDWVLTKDLRERALARRHQVRGVQLTEKTKDLGVLELGTIVYPNLSPIHFQPVL